MLGTMAPRTTTTVRVYPETRAEIARRAEADGITAAEFLERLVRQSEDERLLDSIAQWNADHEEELLDLAREPYPLEPDDLPAGTAR